MSFPVNAPSPHDKRRQKLSFPPSLRFSFFSIAKLFLGSRGTGFPLPKPPSFFTGTGDESEPSLCLDSFFREGRRWRAFPQLVETSSAQAASFLHAPNFREKRASRGSPFLDDGAPSRDPSELGPEQVSYSLSFFLRIGAAPPLHETFFNIDGIPLRFCCREIQRTQTSLF